MNVNKKFKKDKIINVLLNSLIFVFGIILLFSIYNKVQVSIFGKDYSDFFGYSVFEVQTGSMKPEINPGDWIIVKTSKNIQLNDVITYKLDGEYITHRVIGKSGGTYITKGDANNSKDEPIDEKQIIGEVIKTLPNFGILKKTIFNPIVLVSIIITILICNYVFRKNQKEAEVKNVKNKVDLKKKISETKIKLTNKIKQTRSKKEVSKEEIYDDNFTSEKKLEEIVEDENRTLAIVKNNEFESKTEEELDEMFEEITSCIPVDASELDNTFLEIAQNEIEEEQVEETKIKIEEENIEEETETPSKINLELLEKGKKSKNIIEKFISLKIDELNEIINILDDDGKTQVNEPTIKNKLMSSYIDSKYYDYYGDVDASNSKKQIEKTETYMNEIATLLKKKYKGSDNKYSEKVDKFLSIFNVIANLEQAHIFIEDKKAKEEFYKNQLTIFSSNLGWDSSKIKLAITNIIKIQRNYVGIHEYLFKKFETSMFDLEIVKLKSNKNSYAVNLEHNINFSKIYSDYIIDKTYSEGVIAENKIIILLNLLSINLIKDMINSDFNKKYVIYLPESLYTKEKKLEKVLSMIEDEHAKESIIILVSLQRLSSSKTIIRKLKKQGYKFAISINNDIYLDKKYHTIMNISDYIYVDKQIPNVVKILSTLPEDIVDKIIYENIIEKIGDFGGE